MRSVRLSPLSLSACVALVAACGVLVLASGCSSSVAAGEPTDPPTVAGWDGPQPLPPMSKPDVTLTDTSGRPFDMRTQTNGEVTLLYLGYTHCPDICPTVMAELGHVVGSMPANVRSHVRVVFITTDPDRDSPAVVRKWLDSFDTQFIGLTGTTAQIATVAHSLGLATPTKDYIDKQGDYDIEHSAVIWLFDAQDNVAHLEYPADTGAAEFQHDITRLVEKGWPGT